MDRTGSSEDDHPQEVKLKCLWTLSFAQEEYAGQRLRMKETEKRRLNMTTVAVISKSGICINVIIYIYICIIWICVRRAWYSEKIHRRCHERNMKTWQSERRNTTPPACGRSALAGSHGPWWPGTRGSPQAPVRDFRICGKAPTCKKCNTCLQRCMQPPQRRSPLPGIFANPSGYSTSFSTTYLF